MQLPFYQLNNYDLLPTHAVIVTVTLKVGVVLCKTGGIYADMTVFAGMNTPRGSYTCRSLDNNFWNVDILLNHLRKQHQLVKRPISPGQHFPIKLAGPSVPMSVPGSLESTGNQKCPSLLFHSRGKKNRRADQSAEMRGGMLPLQQPQWSWSLTATCPREKTSHCPVTELTVQGRRRKHPSTTASAALPKLAWLSTALACQAKQQPHSCQTWNSTSFQAIIDK